MIAHESRKDIYHRPINLTTPIPYALEPDPAQDWKKPTIPNASFYIQFPNTQAPLHQNTWKFLAENPSLKSQMSKHGYSKRSRHRWNFANQASWKVIAHEIDGRRRNHSVGISSSNTDLQFSQENSIKVGIIRQKNSTSESFGCRYGALRKLLDLQQNWWLRNRKTGRKMRNGRRALRPAMRGSIAAWPTWIVVASRPWLCQALAHEVTRIMPWVRTLTYIFKLCNFVIDPH